MNVPLMVKARSSIIGEKGYSMALSSLKGMERASWDLGNLGQW